MVAGCCIIKITWSCTCWHSTGDSSFEEKTEADTNDIAEHLDLNHFLSNLCGKYFKLSCCIFSQLMFP